MKHHLLASDFDQTLSFNDSGIALSELLGLTGFQDKVTGLSRLNLVQQGGELAYLLRHDPEYRRVRKQDLAEVGRRVRLKRNIPLLTRLLEDGIEGHRFDFYVISAAPEEVVRAAEILYALNERDLLASIYAELGESSTDVRSEEHTSELQSRSS
jgi:hypothetical protein